MKENIQKKDTNIIRRTLALAACRLSSAVLKPFGRGSSLPGKIALMIYPGILSELTLPPTVIAVSGSNGKTSTAEMTGEVLRREGINCAGNSEGSNQIEGVTAFLIQNSDMAGRTKLQAAVLEADERYARLIFRWFSPTCYVITNLYRDQLTRNGHPENVARALRESLRDGTVLIVNADDPMASSLAAGFAGKSLAYAIRGTHAVAGMDRSIYDDSAFCPVCGERMDRPGEAGHLFSCPSCGFSSPTPDHTALMREPGKAVIDGRWEVELTLGGTYTVYNILAAYCACLEAGVDPEAIARSLSGYMLKNGRVASFALGGHSGTFLASKHENSVSYDQNLLTAVSHPGDISVYILVDSISRKYFTSDTSWLWDIDFGILSSPNVKRIVLGGHYADELKLRLGYCGIDEALIRSSADIAESVNILKREAAGHIYALTCFSDEKKLFRELEAQK